MSRITEELLRKRAEHNDMCLTSLEEISLHQQQLIKIQNFDVLCRHLKILYLQNNIIEKMQNLNKLKQLQYLNLALNNISRIQNIQGCQSLKKLDMTVNFIDVSNLYQSALCLSKLPLLKEIYLTGNPCQQWKGCKQFIIAHASTLQCYNGQVVTPSQRIKAIQNLQPLKESLFEAIQKNKLQKIKQEYEEEERKKKEVYMTQQQRKQQKTPYTKQARRQMYEKMAMDKEQKERQRNPEKYVEEKVSSMYNKDGEFRQCNEGRFKFSLKEFEHADYSYFQLEVPKHLSTEQLLVNLDPLWVSVRVKKKLTQLKLSEQIIVHQSKSERSQITGFLLIKMKKLHPHEFLRNKKQKQQLQKKKEQQKQKKSQIQQKQKILRLCDEYEKKMQNQQNQLPDLQ